MRSLVLGLVVLAAIPARAGSFELDLARAHFLTGQSYFDQERFEDALKEFEEAYRLSGRAGFHYNIGVCHEKLGRPDVAIASFRRYLREDPATPDRPVVEARIASLEERKRASAPRASDKPLWRKGWFWGVVGGATALVVAGVAIGVVFGTRGDDVRTLPEVVPE